MGLLDSLFSNKSKTNVSSTTSSTGTVDTTSLVDQINALVEGIRSAGTTRTTKGTEGQAQAVDQVLNLLAQNFGDDFRTRAIADADGAMNAAMAGILEMGLPDIRTGGTTAGGYDSTTQRLMTDNLTAQAAREGATVRLAAIQAAGEQQLAGIQQALQAILTGQEGNIVSTVEEEQNRQAREEGKTTGAENRAVTENTTASGSTTSRERGSGLDIMGDVLALALPQTYGKG